MSTPTVDAAEREPASQSVPFVPTWSAAFEIVLTALEHGTPVGRKMALQELRRVGKLLDEARVLIAASGRLAMLVETDGMTCTAIRQAADDPATRNNSALVQVRDSLARLEALDGRLLGDCKAPGTARNLL